MPTLRPAPLLRAANTISSSARPAIASSTQTTASQTQIINQRGGYGLQARQFTESKSMKADHAHEDHYDPPSGWLWGIKPGEKPEKEGWENVFIYGFFGSLIFGAVAYAFKPDTS
jgi:hypothetical protein